MQLGAEVWPWLVAASLSLALGAWLASCGWGKPAVRALVLFLFARALFDLANGLALASGAFSPPPWVLPVATLLLPGAAITFYGAYHREHGHEVQWTRFGWPVSVMLVALYLVVPQTWAYTSDGDIHFGPLFVFYGLNYLLYAALALDLGRHAIKADGLRRRRSLLWLGLGFAFLPAYVSASDFLFIDILKERVLVDGWVAAAHWVSVAAGLVLLALFGLLARNTVQTKDEAHKVDVAWMLGALVVPLLTVLIIWGLRAANVASIAALVGAEGLWSVLHPIFVAVAVARFGVFGLELRAVRGLQWMLMVALFPLAFGLGWMAGINSLPNQPTWLVATIFAVALLPFSKVLWGLTGNWAHKILDAEATP